MPDEFLTDAEARRHICPFQQAVMLTNAAGVLSPAWMNCQGNSCMAWDNLAESTARNENPDNLGCCNRIISPV